MNIHFNTTYIFAKPKNAKIVLMKVEMEVKKGQAFTQKYIMKKEKKGWKKVSMKKFNSLGLKLVDKYYGVE